MEQYAEGGYRKIKLKKGKIRKKVKDKKTKNTKQFFLCGKCKVTFDCVEVHN